MASCNDVSITGFTGVDSGHFMRWYETAECDQIILQSDFGFETRIFVKPKK